METNEALEYIKNFAIKFAKENFNKDITIFFNNTIRNWGMCFWRDNRIRFNINFIETNKDNPKALEALAIHECCHLKIHGHGKDFKQLCNKFGLNSHTSKSNVGVKEVQPKQYYLYWCPNCKIEIKKLKQNKREGACAACCETYNSGEYDEKFKLRWRYVDEVFDNGNK